MPQIIIIFLLWLAFSITSAYFVWSTLSDYQNNRRILFGVNLTCALPQIWTACYYYGMFIQSFS